MLKFIQKKLKEEKGLTLIELLAVIVILGIIAAIAIPAIGNIMDNSRTGAIKSDAINIMSAADLYFAEVTNDSTPNTATTQELQTSGYLDDPGSFPVDANTLVTQVNNGQNTFTGTGTAGSITLTFNAATRDHINSLQNNQSNIGTITTISAQ
ncbi:PilD-dependent protein pddA [Bhargavaea cecembensis DSE10]|uniref:PilD-dependent protein pddA n=1 Tax=Bhargavaea cecembensis DSE10 TaxID=1235279 RepID=M7NDF5_9BACL|nr:prepilin-type N-terminal cleavage/methylation domain-containing protein [Bhargavaea cecembensis]EMR05206.1 PilD-dependent protein pddA [Bhargavaea cecembensis DSE10]